MANVLIMPRLGNTVESCIIVGWKAAEGASVAADTAVCEVETDKATMDVPAGVAGTILKILRVEGDDVPVLEPIAVIGAPGEDWQAALGGAAAGTAAAGAAGAAAGAGAEEPSGTAAVAAAGAQAGAAAPAGGVQAAAQGAAQAAIPAGGAPASTQGAAQAAAQEAGPPAPGVSPRARGLAASEGFEASRLAGTGPGGRVIERDVRAALEARPALTAAARAAAVSSAGSAAMPSGGGALGGRAGVADLAAARAQASVHAALEAELSAAAGVVSAPQAAGAPQGAFAAAQAATSSGAALPFPGPFVDAPLKSVRKLIADRMSASLHTTAQLTLNATAPADRMLALRQRFKESGEALGMSGVTLGDLVLFAVSRTLPAFPALNAHLSGGVLRTFAHVHLGVAVDTPRGLMVPVVRNADLLSLGAISAEVKRLAAACIEGRANPDELGGSTFTVSNLGASGIESFTPVLNAPETGILGVCSVVPRAVPGPDGAVRFERRMGLSFTMDHQAADGADGARFLKALSQALADIDITIAK